MMFQLEALGRTHPSAFLFGVLKARSEREKSGEAVVKGRRRGNNAGDHGLLMICMLSMNGVIVACVKG